MVYITYPDQEEAKRVGDLLLSKKIIACYNVFPVKSSYLWNGSVAQEDEVVSLLKTRKENRDILKSQVEENHPYEIPCIIKIDVESNHQYESRIQNEIPKIKD